jgi:hypothetical protein
LALAINVVRMNFPPNLNPLKIIFSHPHKSLSSILFREQTLTPLCANF